MSSISNRIKKLLTTRKNISIIPQGNNQGFPQRIPQRNYDYNIPSRRDNSSGDQCDCEYICVRRHTIGYPPRVSSNLDIIGSLAMIGTCFGSTWIWYHSTDSTYLIPALSFVLGSNYVFQLAEGFDWNANQEKLEKYYQTGRKVTCIRKYQTMEQEQVFK